MHPDHNPDPSARAQGLPANDAQQHGLPANDPDVTAPAGSDAQGLAGARDTYTDRAGVTRFADTHEPVDDEEPDTFDATQAGRPAVGAVVTFDLDDGAGERRGLVVNHIDGDEDRDEAVEVVPLIDSVVVPAGAVLGED